METATDTLLHALAERLDEASFEQTIPRGLVHKAGPEAVWLTDVGRLGDAGYYGIGQVPRTHAYLDDRVGVPHGHCDLAMLVELSRQAGIAVTHRFLGVPESHPTIFMKLSITVTDPSPTDWTPAPAPVGVGVEILNIDERDGVPESFAADLVIVVDGRERARATTLWAAHEPTAYKGARADARQGKPLDERAPSARPLPPEQVGRRNPDNVLIGEPERDGRTYRGPVVVDEQHPYFYEHPVDHIPGVLMLEAFRQAALVAATDAHGLPGADAVVVRCDARFTDFAENELPLDCEAKVADPDPDDDGVTVPVRLRLEQPGTGRVAQASLGMRFPSA